MPTFDLEIIYLNCRDFVLNNYRHQLEFVGANRAIIVHYVLIDTGGKYKAHEF